LREALLRTPLLPSHAVAFTRGALPCEALLRAAFVCALKGARSCVRPSRVRVCAGHLRALFLRDALLRARHLCAGHFVRAQAGAFVCARSCVRMRAGALKRAFVCAHSGVRVRACACAFAHASRKNSFRFVCKRRASHAAMDFFTRSLASFA
jgi:hypothetical protein